MARARRRAQGGRSSKGAIASAPLHPHSHAHKNRLGPTETLEQLLDIEERSRAAVTEAPSTRVHASSTAGLTPITAAHVKYGLERALATPDSPFAEFLDDIDGAHDMATGNATTCAGITADGDHRLVITLAHVNPALLDILAMPFATPQRAEHVAAAGDQLRRRPDATGPFELASWDEGNRIVLRRNPHYYDPARVHLDEIAVLENIPRDTQFQMFERGELDSTGKLAAPDYVLVMTEPGWRPYVRHTIGLNAFGSRMNVRVKPFDDRRVRQALNYALDKSHTARLLNATTVAAHGILPPGMFGRDPTCSRIRTTSPRRARCSPRQDIRTGSTSNT